MTLDGASFGSILEKSDKDELSLALATAGNRNREAKNRNEKKSDPCSAGFLFSHPSGVLLGQTLAARPAAREQLFS